MINISISEKRNQNLVFLIKILIYLQIITIPLTIAGVNFASGLLLLTIIPYLFFYDSFNLFEERIDKGIFTFAIIILLSSLWSLSPYYVFRRFLSPVLQYIILYYAIINFIKTKQELKIAFTCYWISNVLSSFYAINQYFILGVRRASGLVKISNRLGSIMAMFIIFNFSLVLFAKQKKVKLIGVIGMVVGTFGLFASVSRSSILALGIGLFIVAVLKDKRMIVAFLIAVIAITFFLPEHFMARLSQLTDLDSNNVKFRIMMYETGLELFRNNPLTGIGFNNIRLIYDEFGVLQEMSFKHRHLHNIFINVGVELGIFGLINLLFILIAVIKKAWGNFKEKKNLFTAAILGIIAGQIFQNSVDVLLHATQVGLTFVLFMGIMNLKNNDLLIKNKW